MHSISCCMFLWWELYSLMLTYTIKSFFLISLLPMTLPRYQRQTSWHWEAFCFSSSVEVLPLGVLIPTPGITCGATKLQIPPVRTIQQFQWINWAGRSNNIDQRSEVRWKEVREHKTESFEQGIYSNGKRRELRESEASPTLKNPLLMNSAGIIPISSLSGRIELWCR